MNLYSDMKIFYCKDWLWGENQGAINPLTPGEAEELHNLGKYYVAVIGLAINNPNYVITLDKANNIFSVEFFDSYSRGYLTHNFHKKYNSENYFLSMEIWRKYVNPTSHELKEAISFSFDCTSNKCYILKEDFIKKERYEKTESYLEKGKGILFPEFGKYTDILDPNLIW